PTEHDPCILVRPAEHVLVAFNQKCTHLSCAVIPRVDEGIIRCPCHDGVFDLASGRPLAGPPRRPLVRVLLEVRGGEIYATGHEERTTCASTVRSRASSARRSSTACWRSS